MSDVIDSVGSAAKVAITVFSIAVITLNVAWGIAIWRGGVADRRAADNNAA